MTTPIQVHAGHLLRPQAGDLLVFTTDLRMSREQHEYFSKAMRQLLPGVKVITLDCDIKLADIHTNAEIQRLLALLPASDQPIPEPFNLDTACQDAMDRLTDFINERAVSAQNGYRWETSRRMLGYRTTARG